MEATLRVKIKEIQIEGEDGEATKTFEKNLHGFHVHRNQEEPAFHGQIVKPDIKLIEKKSDVQKVEAILNVLIKGLEIELQLKDAKVEQLETAIQEKGVETRPLLLGSQNSRRGKKKFKLFCVMYILNNFPCSTDFTDPLPLNIHKIPNC